VCLQLEPWFAGSKTAEDNGFLRGIKIQSTPSFRGEVKLLAPFRKILQHDKDPSGEQQRNYIG
jgi:hypothetical protein